jgi:hypothetical protein
MLEHLFGWDGLFTLTIGVSDLMHPPIVQTFTVSLGQMVDADGDGLPDTYENAFGCLDPQVADASIDPDADGLTAFIEYEGGSNSCERDTDGDGYDDEADQSHGGAAASAYCGVMRADVDASNDGQVTILDIAEVGSWFSNGVPPAPSRLDQDSDGEIVILDLAIAGSYFGKRVTVCPI